MLVLLFANLHLSPAFAKTTNADAIADNAISEFKDWMKKHKIKGGAIAISHNGRLVDTFGIKRNANTPAPVASLSKAITAVCTIKALEASGNSPDLSLGEAIPGIFSKNKKADSRYKTVSIGQLITHNSGIHSRYHRKYIDSLLSLKKEKKEKQMKKLLREKMSANPGTGYHYSNANYLALGLVIETLTGQSYEKYCNDNVLKPLNITSAKLYNTWRVMSSWGGWQISAKDYLDFANHYFAESKVMGSSPTDQVHTQRGNGVLYSLGTLARSTRSGYNFWHSGSWRWKAQSRNAKFGAYFAVYSNGYSISVNYDHDAYDGQQRELDKLLYRATHP